MKLLFAGRDCEPSEQGTRAERRGCMYRKNDIHRIAALLIEGRGIREIARTVPCSRVRVRRLMHELVADVRALAEAEE